MSLSSTSTTHYKYIIFRVIWNHSIVFSEKQTNISVSHIQRAIELDHCVSCTWEPNHSDCFCKADHVISLKRTYSKEWLVRVFGIAMSLEKVPFCGCQNADLWMSDFSPSVFLRRKKAILVWNNMSVLGELLLVYAVLFFSCFPQWYSSGYGSDLLLWTGRLNQEEDKYSHKGHGQELKSHTSAEEK